MLPSSSLRRVRTSSARRCLALSHAGVLEASIRTILGRSGWAQAFGYSGTTQKVKLQLGVTDNAADGHHVAVRFVAENVDGDVKKWRWRHPYGGNDTQSIWNTTATEDSGIFRIGVQTGVFEKGKLLCSCGDWAF